MRITIQEYNGFTLIEVVIAMVLMSLVILAATSVDMTSRRLFGSATEEAQVQNETKIAMEHIVKNLALGNSLYFLGAGDPYTIWARRDTDASGNSNNTPAEFNDDTWICYRMITEAGKNKIRYYPNTPSGSFSGTTEDIASGVCQFSVNNNLVTVTVTDVLTNPQISLTSSVALRAMSIN